MIELRGAEIHPPGGRITFVVRQINVRFNTPETVTVVLIDDEFSMVTEEGFREYGHSIIEDDEYYIIVAARREELNVAGIVGYQYGLYLQHFLGCEQDHEEAVLFAKYVNAQSSKYPISLMDALNAAGESR
ncbi:hypothetical protein [Paenibacillus rubinfantis]|uniref:hypothetical protein n=1 Tax=Paenibacillus rubinfantis TaxID=1720296 RepID=UPI0009E80E93|nr:hypothetical protein [Paenibacillus rubinfantis]